MIDKPTKIKLFGAAFLLAWVLIFAMQRFSPARFLSLFTSVEGLGFLILFLALFTYLIFDFLKNMTYTKLMRAYVKKYHLSIEQLSKLTDIDEHFFSIGVNDRLLVGGRKQKAVLTVLYKKYGPLN